MKRSITKLLVAMAGAGLLATSANAGTTTYNPGDLFLGFRQAGSANDYLIDIGPASQFVNASAPFVLSLALPTKSMGDDLTAAFDANWFNESGPKVMWAVIGGDFNGSGYSGDAGLPVIYTSNPSATAWAPGTGSQQNSLTTRIDAMSIKYKGNPSTANTAEGLIQLSTSANSYASYQPGGANSGNISFQFFNPSNETAVNQTLYLNRLVPSDDGPPFNPILLGSFSMASNGTVTFSPVAVPEPSAYASFIIGAGLLLLILRRRKGLIP